MVDVSANFPVPTSPLVDQQGRITIPWLHFLRLLFDRTGGGSGATGVPGGSGGNIQANGGGGTFSGLTDVSVTARIQPFTASLSGAAPASGGGTVHYLRADGSWTAPAPAGPAGGDLSGSYPDPSVASIGGQLVTLGGAFTIAGAFATTLTVAADTALTLPASGTVTALGNAATGSGDVVLATAPTLTGATVDGPFALTSQTSGPGTAGGTLTNAPTAGNPAFWVPVDVNGTTYHFPVW